MQGESDVFKSEEKWLQEKKYEKPSLRVKKEEIKLKWWKRVVPTLVVPCSSSNFEDRALVNNIFELI